MATPSHARRQRLTALIHMAPELVPGRDYDTVEQERYGLGPIRDVEVFYKLFLVDTVKREAQPLCKFVEPGESASQICRGDSIPNTSTRGLNLDAGRMHRDFTKFLRADGRGIDYSVPEVRSPLVAIFFSAPASARTSNPRPHARSAFELRYARRHRQTAVPAYCRAAADRVEEQAS